VGTEQKIVEQHALAEDSNPTRLKFGESLGDKYRVRAIAEGDGSSGHYGKKMLKRDFAAALPEGSRMRANHDGLCEDGGDIRRVIGRTISKPEWQEASGDDPAGMYVDILVSEQWSPQIREFGDIIGLSISMAGEYEDVPEGWHSEGADLVKYSADGEEVSRRRRDVIRLASAEEYPYSSLDFVEAPGADGRILQALESARQHLPDLNLREAASFAGNPFDAALRRAHEASGQPGGTEEDIEVDEQTLRSILAEAKSDTLEAVKATIAEASKPASEPIEKPTLERTAEAVVGAGLTEHGRKAVYAAIERGADLDEAIAAQKAYEDSVRESVKAEFAADESLVQRGFVVGAGDADSALGEFADTDSVLAAIGEAR
jgi:hypothetical protein